MVFQKLGPFCLRCQCYYRLVPLLLDCLVFSSLCINALNATKCHCLMVSSSVIHTSNHQQSRPSSGLSCVHPGSVQCCVLWWCLGSSRLFPSGSQTLLCVLCCSCLGKGAAPSRICHRIYRHVLAPWCIHQLPSKVSRHVGATYGCWRWR